MRSETPVTLTYKNVQNTALTLDVYLPQASRISPDSVNLSAVVYFHGGGLTAGNRRSWFPSWLHKRITNTGHLFVCPDYRLIPSGSTTGHEILEDVKDLFAFLIRPDFQESLVAVTEMLGKSFCIDPKRIVAAGSSSGGLCAYLAAVHALPKPRAVLSLYGMGGDFLTPHYYKPKTTVFFRGREILDPLDFKEFTYPLSLTGEVIADSPTAYHPADSPTPGYPANPRMFLARLYLQLGVYLDYYTGEHEPSLSSIVRRVAAESDELDDTGSNSQVLKQKLLELVPERHRLLFPCCGISSSWPPTIFFHGSEDSAVPVHESRYMHDLLKEAGVSTQLIVAKNMEHSFDYQPEAELKHGDSFDCIVGFLNQYLCRDTES